jgi:hypothetical protein
MSLVYQSRNQGLIIEHHSLRVDLIGEVPIFGHYIVAEPRHFVAGINDSSTAIRSDDKPNSVDINNFDETLTKISGGSDSGGITPNFHESIGAAVDSKTSDILLTQNLPISDDVAKLQAEEQWLERAIRERISVRS